MTRLFNALFIGGAVGVFLTPFAFAYLAIFFDYRLPIKWVIISFLAAMIVGYFGTGRFLDEGEDCE